MAELQNWSRTTFGNVTWELEHCRSQLEELMRMNADRQEIRKVSDRMNELLYHEEMMWLHRSRIDWLHYGDRNTNFFHHKLVWRAKKNWVKRIEDPAGVVHTDQVTMGTTVTNYFQSLFTRDDRSPCTTRRR